MSFAFNSHGILQFDSYQEYIEFEREANHENNFTEEKQRPHVEKDLEVLIPYIKSKSSKIVSVGTRDFFDLRYLSKRGYKNVVGVDLDKRSVELAKKYRINFIREDVHKLELKNIDVIYCRHTLEHCYNPKLVMQNFVSSLSPDGIMLLVVPIEKELHLEKRRGHCVHWKNLSAFEKFCKKYFDEILCFPNSTSVKKSQALFLGRLQSES